MVKKKAVKKTRTKTRAKTRKSKAAPLKKAVSVALADLRKIFRVKSK